MPNVQWNFKKYAYLGWLEDNLCGSLLVFLVKQLHSILMFSTTQNKNRDNIKLLFQ